MRSRRLLALCMVPLIAGFGCRSVRGLKDKSNQPLTLTSEEAEGLRAEGVALYLEQPRTLVSVTLAARKLEQAARTLSDNYDVQWQTAQALAFLAENETRPSFRLEAARHGIIFARHGRELDPNRVECHYWYAINVGWFADVDRSYGLKAVGEMESALRRAIQLDERYDYAGPVRVLGILYLRTPALPVSIGSQRRGLRMLQHAVELFPDYPENYIYLAEALHDNERVSEAREALAKVLELKPWPGLQSESATWKAEAEKLLKDLPGK